MKKLNEENNHSHKSPHKDNLGYGISKLLAQQRSCDAATPLTYCFNPEKKKGKGRPRKERKSLPSSLTRYKGRFFSKSGLVPDAPPHGSGVKDERLTTATCSDMASPSLTVSMAVPSRESASSFTRLTFDFFFLRFSKYMYSHFSNEGKYESFFFSYGLLSLNNLLMVFDAAFSQGHNTKKCANVSCGKVFRGLLLICQSVYSHNKESIISRNNDTIIILNNYNIFIFCFGIFYIFFFTRN